MNTDRLSLMDFVPSSGILPVFSLYASPGLVSGRKAASTIMEINPIIFTR